MPDSPIIAQSTGSPVQAVRYVLAVGTVFVDG